LQCPRHNTAANMLALIWGNGTVHLEENVLILVSKSKVLSHGLRRRSVSMEQLLLYAARRTNNFLKRETSSLKQPAFNFSPCTATQGRNKTNLDCKKMDVPSFWMLPLQPQVPLLVGGWVPTWHVIKNTLNAFFTSSFIQTVVHLLSSARGSQNEETAVRTTTGNCRCVVIENFFLFFCFCSVSLGCRSAAVGNKVAFL